MSEVTFFKDTEVDRIRETYPLCYNLITKMVCNSDAPGIPDDIRDKVIGVSDLLVRSMLTSGARELYDFFDSHNVICTLEQDDNMFYYMITPPDKISIIHNNKMTVLDANVVRRSLEVDMFMKAFEITENIIGRKGEV